MDVGIVVENVDCPPAIAIPLLKWLSNKGMSAEYQARNSLKKYESTIRLWALKDDELSDVAPESGKDFALAALAPDGFDVIHPAVSISKAIGENIAITEFEECTWMCSTKCAESKAKELLRIPDDKLILLNDPEKRSAYHLALCLAVPEVFTLYEAAREVLLNGLDHAEFQHAWNHVIATAKRAAQVYTDDHYHGPASRLDKTSLARHINTLQARTPWIFPLYSELIQYRIVKTAVHKERLTDLGFGKLYWDTTSKSISDIGKNPKGDTYISDADGESILDDVRKALPCKPLILSLTFFHLEITKKDETTTLIPSLKGEGFVYFRSHSLKTEFHNQIHYYLDNTDYKGISKQITESDAATVRPFIVVPASKKEMIQTEFLNTISSERQGGYESLTDVSESFQFSRIDFGDREKSPYVAEGPPPDGWFPLRYRNIVELVIPLFRFKTPEGRPLLEGLVTIVSGFDELACLTPARISTIQSLALKRYMSVGHLERRLIDYALGSKMEQIKKPLEELLELRVKMEKAVEAISNIEDVLNPYRLWVADTELRKFSGELAAIFNTKLTHDVKDWDAASYVILKEIWCKNKQQIAGQLATSSFNGLYEKYFSFFDRENDTTLKGYIAKAMHESGSCPLYWVYVATDKDSDWTPVNSNKKVLLEGGVPALPFSICLQELKDHVTKVEVSPSSPDTHNWGTLLVTIAIKANAHGTVGLGSLKGAIEERSKADMESMSRTQLSKNHTSSAVAVLRKAASQPYAEMIIENNSLSITLSYKVGGME